jgi:hypothetical protein
MANQSLLSVGQLCDGGYIVTFKQASVTICNSKKSQILNGPRDLNTGLWRINLKQTNNHTTEPIANNVYELRNIGALVYYLQKALSSPTKSTMLQAVKDGHLITWPGLTEDAINRPLKLTPATAMGHMNQKRQKHKVHLENADCVSTNTEHRLGHENPPRVCRRGRSRPTLHQLDGKIPYPIQRRQLICHGLLCLRLQLF